MLAPSIFSVSKPEIQFSLFANLYEDVVAISVLRGVINRSSQSHLRQRPIYCKETPGYQVKLLLLAVGGAPGSGDLAGLTEGPICVLLFCKGVF